MMSPLPAHVPSAAAPILQGFDRVAWCYDALAWLVFGSAQRRAQRAALAALPAGQPHVLVLGGGTGWVLVEVLRRRPQATVLYLEASGAMLKRAAARLRRHCPAHRQQVTFRHGTQADLQPQETFGVIVTFFVLDCVAPADFEPALQQLNAARQPGAPWLVADFALPRRWWQHALVQMMYCFFRLTTNLVPRQLPPLRPALQALGLELRDESTFFGGAIEALVYGPTIIPENIGAYSNDFQELNCIF